MRIRTTPALVTAVLAAVIAVAGCSSAHPAASASTAPAQSSTSFTMPNEVGHVLQDAQDDLQRVSGNSAYYSRSHDLLWQQAPDSRSKLAGVHTNVAEGASVSESDTVDFGVVKLSESCP